MSLAEKVSIINDDFENASSKQILDVLEQMMPEFKTNLTSEYLQGKMQKILDLDDESEKKNQCKALKPYLDWYLQGL